MTVDFLAGMTATVLWIVLVRPALISALPTRLRDRSHVEPMTRRAWLLLPVGVIIGALTHVAWDELTHAGRWGARHVAWLSDDHFGYAGYHWAQAASSALGLSAVVTYAGRAMSRRRPEVRAVAAPSVARWLMVAAVVVTACVGTAHLVTNVHEGLHAAAIAAAVHALGAMVVTTLVAGAVWRIAARSPRARRPVDGEATQ